MNTPRCQLPDQSVDYLTDTYSLESDGTDSGMVQWSHILAQIRMSFPFGCTSMMGTGSIEIPVEEKRFANEPPTPSSSSEFI